MKKYGAQIVFQERGWDSHGCDAWTGRLLNPEVYDRTDWPFYEQRRVDGVICTITERRVAGTVGSAEERMVYDMWIQGGARGGRRYFTYDTLDHAQAAAIKWARRRFYHL